MGRWVNWSNDFASATWTGVVIGFMTGFIIFFFQAIVSNFEKMETRITSHQKETKDVLHEFRLRANTLDREIQGLQRRIGNMERAGR